VRKVSLRVVKGLCPSVELCRESLPSPYSNRGGARSPKPHFKDTFFLARES